MRVKDALLVEGTSDLAILCYGIVPANALTAAVAALSSAPRRSGSRVHELLAEDWPHGIAMTETLVSENTDMIIVVSEALREMSELASPLAAVCMYDGAFGHFEDIFSPQTASQTYGFCIAKGEPVVVLDSAVLVSPEWAAVIAQCRRRTYEARP